ncbi:D-glycero-beta-D-manno-heptose 1-phosphate adenylyltransferase [Nocardia otitidiscaviarum]|uniref:D-glycero-beta-D-manno-heptose 1-phosphate adenylyltransferase n=1 Tax=Nocardia otitidiscaviarum TaxID=1823 RepID=UPI00069442BF|nr:D-glycero-beta-D-manno-heptose 1-phosphate adenylyltransferase [Nocardia otitidiscaviarum]MBF6135180.1 D-glycero-beta-D-manno-heptose 1-phosphate adenylyltransferase [Nocardia otitidiscaviarum]MBF6487001.1 D-glycero-beta-D-manno-heptose 1-phosphate adenylyltransferase [Nocardia otitidiscaviarum]
MTDSVTDTGASAGSAPPGSPTPEAADLLSRQDATVVVLGDAVLDVWMRGRSDRLCREAPVPVVAVHSTAYLPGGAANTAANLAGLGATVRLVTLTGDDLPGERLRTALRRTGVVTDYLRPEPDRSTVTKCRIVAGDHIVVRFDEGDPAPADGGEVERLLDTLPDALAGADALVVCDYDGTLGERLPAGLAARRDELPLLVVDTHHPERWAALRPDLITPNADEAARVLGVGPPAPGESRVELFDHHRDRLYTSTGASAVVVTLDRDGSILLTGDRPAHRTWSDPVPDSQSPGAGDTFVAALTLAVLAGLPLTAGVELAQAAADVVVHRTGTSVCTTSQLRERLSRTSGAVLTARELAAVVARHRALDRRIVFTNGCFDVLHAGHIAYLNEAKRLGDVLVVAVNSDRSVRQLKGPDRPVNPDHERAAVLAALSCVDHVTIFDDDTPATLLRDTTPDLYVKGGDYRADMLPEAPVVRAYGGAVQVLSYLADHSTSAVIERIRTGSVS